MNDTIIDLRKLPQWLFIGYATDNAARPQVFDFSSWVEEYGAGTLELNLQRPGDEVPYPVTLSIEGTTATWTPSSEDTKAKGQGMAQFVYTVGGTVPHTAILRVLIGGSLGAGEDAPNGFENWFQKMQVLAAAAADSADASAASADSAEESAETAAEILEDVGTAGAEQIQAIGEAGTAQITAVGEAGAAQVQAVEDKGKEVLESIPADYTELSGDVDDLKSSYNPVGKTAAMTQPVGKDGSGKLWTAPGGGSAELIETATGTEVNFTSKAGTPKEFTVDDLTYSQGDVTNVAPDNPVAIYGVTADTLTINGASSSADFSAAAPNGVGNATWDVLGGKLQNSVKIITVTEDMVQSAQKVTADNYGSRIELGVAFSAINACSHYPIRNSIIYPGLYWHTPTAKLYIYDENITSDLAAAKAYIAGLGVKIAVTLTEPETLDVTPVTVNLIDGANAISAATGTMTIQYARDLQSYVDDAIDAVESIADSALEAATTAMGNTTDLQVEVDTLSDDTYRYRTETGSNTGTDSASGGDTIHWGFVVEADASVELCRSVTFIPQCTNTDDGTYTATRWKNSTGEALVSGETLEVVEVKTANKGESVTFDYVGIDEFIAVSFTSGTTQRSSTSAVWGAQKMRLGWVNPQTGVITTFYQYCLSGVFTAVYYKPIAGDCMTLFGKKITLIGDSITEKNGRADVNHGMWLERWTGCQIQNLGQGGTGFARTPGSTNYKLRISRVNADVDIIGVAASFNDLIYNVGTPTDTAADNTVCGYANAFFDELIAAFPTKRICCYSEGPWYNYHPGVTKSDDLMAALKTICEAHGVVWDDGLYRGCALRPWMQANCEVYYKGESGQYADVVDNIHPNSAGQQVIARWLERLFEKVVD